MTAIERSGHQLGAVLRGGKLRGTDIYERIIDHIEVAIEVDQPTKVTKRVKARLIGFSEIVERFREILSELERHPLNEKLIVEKGSQLAFVLELCVSQMKATRSTVNAERRAQLAILEVAKRNITYKMNTCTVDEISKQVTLAYKAFGIQ